MSPKPPRPDEAGTWVKIIRTEEKYRFKDLFRVVEAEFQFRQFEGGMSEPETRVDFERGDSVGVLLYDPADDDVVLVHQFRYPVYAGLDAAAREGDGARRAWLLEIVAGVHDPGRTVKGVARKELLEEAGYQVKGELQPITIVYPSPGGSSERIHLFLGEVEHRQRVAEGGGVPAEGEDIQIVVLPFSQAMDMVARGQINDAKTIIALQHLAMRKVNSK